MTANHPNNARRGRPQVRWCGHCQIDVQTNVVQGWNNLKMSHTFLHQCPYCGRILTTEEYPAEPGQ